MRLPATRSTWFYVASLLEIALATDLLLVGWASDRHYMTVVIPLALVSAGISASFWGRPGGVIATGVSCGVLLVWRDSHSAELTRSDFIWASLYCVTALILAVLALQRRFFEEQVIHHEESLAAGLKREAALSRSKDEFLSLLAHELRNPVAVLVGSSDLLEKQKVSGVEKEEVIHDIHLEASRVSHLLEDLFSIARFDAGLVPDREPLSIAPLVASAVEEFHQRYQHPVDVEVDESSPLALGSKVQVERVICNLLSNAGKYSPRASKITVVTMKADESIKVDILDRGTGIPSGTNDLMFEAFERLTAEEQARSYGLGLAISKRLVEANGGQIWAKNRGGGLDVGFSLPLFHE